MNENFPLVSIIIPCYNRAWCVEDAINSALKQTYKHFEVIVIDDGSTDNTVEIVKGYANYISLIRKKNGGVSSARNIGLKESRGDFIVFLDSDDVLSSDFLECHIKSFNLYPGADIYIADSAFIDKDGKLKIHHCTLSNVPSRPLEVLFLSPPPSFPSQMYRREALIRVGGFDEEMRYGEDSDLLLRVILSGGSLMRTEGGYSIIRPSPDSLTHVTGKVSYHKSYVIQCRKLAHLFGVDNIGLQKLITARMDFWRDRFWSAILIFHFSSKPLEIIKLLYYLMRISLVDPGYLSFMLRRKPWSNKHYIEN